MLSSMCSAQLVVVAVFLCAAGVKYILNIWVGLTLHQCTSVPVEVSKHSGIICNTVYSNSNSVSFGQLSQEYKCTVFCLFLTLQNKRN